MTSFFESVSFSLTRRAVVNCRGAREALFQAARIRVADHLTSELRDGGRIRSSEGSNSSSVPQFRRSNDLCGGFFLRAALLFDFPLSERIPVAALRTFPRSGPRVRRGRIIHLDNKMAVQTPCGLAVNKTSTGFNRFDHRFSSIL